MKLMYVIKFRVPFIYIHRRLSSNIKQLPASALLPAQAYQPHDVEKTKYEDWEKRSLFKAENPSSKSTFSMVLPPPNVTGKLHLGHALACTVQDVIVRHKRCTGHNVLWLPGTDHAGIATQGVVEKYLKSKKGINRHEIGREKFIDEVWKWKEEHGDTICNQLRTLGCSLDWSRQVFTMDPAHTHAVNTAFLHLFQRGLIYRKKALVNWCNELQSTVSDIEVENLCIDGITDLKLPNYDRVIKFGQLYNFAYKLCNEDAEVVVSTTMPETMLGDTAIAVHPHDVRYTHLHGKRAKHPFRKDTIPIIVDDFVDMDFGTGAVKITPAHSKLDFEISKQHNLPLIEVIDEDGLMQNSGSFNKMRRYDCRNLIIHRLKEMDLFKQVIPHKMTLPICSRTGNVIDHLPKEQWFLSCSQLNERAAKLVTTGQLKIEPEKFIKNWLNWTGDDRDWCISRQLWWGHQIPAYKCSVDMNVVWIAAYDEKSAQFEASKYLRTLPDLITAERDSDVLDTWFSSGIYPFSVLGWPHCYQNMDYKQFYPLTLMATGHDILGFWVHRMVILGLELTGQLPFRKVLLHGIICDSKGTKMSKSRGNVIDPLDVINGISLVHLKEKTEEMHKNGILSRDELDKALAYHKANFSHTNGIPQCGVDALRFTLLSHDIKSHFVNFDVAMCYANKLFCNKIWQSVNYTQLSCAKLKKIDKEITVKDLTTFDKWILSRLAAMVDKVNESMDNCDFHLATKALRTLIYNEFCDIYLEATKPGFDDHDSVKAYAHAHTLSVVLNTSLRCLAPFMIYLTEELVPKIPTFESNIIHNYNDLSNAYYDFPNYQDFKMWRNEDIDKQVFGIIQIVKYVRELKSIYNIRSKLRTDIYIKTNNKPLIEDIKQNKAVVLRLTRCNAIKYDGPPTMSMVVAKLDKDTTICLEIVGEDVSQLIHAAKAKIQKKCQNLEDTVKRLENDMKRSPPKSSRHVEVLKKKLESAYKALEDVKRLM